MNRDIPEEVQHQLQEQWDHLTLADDFMFCKIMQDKELCAEMIRRILPDIDIGEIKFVNTQKNIREGIDTRGIRLDVFSKFNTGKVCDVEIQTANKYLSKRSRAYHMLISYDALSKDNMKSHYYNDLHDAFVIFICTFDPFALGRHI